MTFKSPAQIQDLKYDTPAYWDMMSPEKGADTLVQVLLHGDRTIGISPLPLSTSFLEIGAGRGRNTLPIARAGYKITAQEISKAVIERTPGGLIDNVRTEILLIHDTLLGDISVIELPESYDAIVSIRVLHFIETIDAESTIKKLQNHTHTTGVNAYVFFTDETPHGPNENTSDPFFPSIEHMIELYALWDIYWQDEIQRSLITQQSNGRSMVSKSIIFKKR